MIQNDKPTDFRWVVSDSYRPLSSEIDPSDLGDSVTVDEDTGEIIDIIPERKSKFDIQTGSEFD